MARIALAGLSYGHDGSIAVIEDVTAQLEAGWIGVVGPNGGGKTTLLRLCAGALTPRSGSISVEPVGARVLLCAQTVEEPDEQVLALGSAWDKAALRWHKRLALDPEQLARWPTLSPGERKRWQIGAALAAQPDLLLLDEPTNHLDGTTRELLIGALARFRGLGLVVSHDRALLEALTRQTLRVHGGTAVLHGGAYGEARAQWQADRERVLAQAERASARVRKEERRLVRTRQARAAAAVSLSAGKRMKGIRDSDARGVAAKERVRAAEARIGREVGNTRRALARASEARAAHRVVRERGGAVAFDFEPAPRPVLCRLERARLAAGDRVLARDVALALARDARVRVAGRNGAGKSTLLAALLEDCDVRERLLHVPQELADDERADIAVRLRAMAPGARGRVLQIAATLGVDPDRALASSAPSPGEARKLLLAAGLARKVWALVLDEPTNHLDLPAIERLQAALAAYPGAIVLATHDDAFAAALTTTEWRFADGTVQEV